MRGKRSVCSTILILVLNQKICVWHEHENLVFYAKAAFDIEYNFPFGFKELEGVHARGNYDLTQHQTFSDVAMEYLDPYTNEKIHPACRRNISWR
jgi:glycyl-tRNA synthetase (class II)